MPLYAGKYAICAFLQNMLNMLRSHDPYKPVSLKTAFFAGWQYAVQQRCGVKLHCKWIFCWHFNLLTLICIAVLPWRRIPLCFVSVPWNAGVQAWRKGPTSSHVDARRQLNLLSTQCRRDSFIINVRRNVVKTRFYLEFKKTYGWVRESDIRLNALIYSLLSFCLHWERLQSLFQISWKWLLKREGVR